MALFHIQNLTLHGPLNILQTRKSIINPKKFGDEYLELLKESEIDYDERYILKSVIE